MAKIDAFLKAATAAAAVIDIVQKPEVQEKVKHVAKKAWDNRETIKDVADVAAPVVKKAVKKGVAVGAKAADHAGDAAGNVARAAGNAADAAAGAVKASVERRAQEKALAQARQDLLQSATAKMSAGDFEDTWATSLDGGTAAPLKSPGYFIIATYKGKPANDRLYDYRDVFVSRSDDMGASIHRHLSGEGNPDVYADMKYEQKMLVFAFPDFDFEDDDNETLCRFITALRADASYNARAAR
ncbi:MAG: hypothetical protein Q4B69_00495, partial [Slackia sp.]|nr:hypothetical protein [Slackia sp.]